MRKNAVVAALYDRRFLASCSDYELGRGFEKA